MIRLTRFTGAALLCSLSLLCTRPVSAQFDFDGFVEEFEHHFESDHFFDNHHDDHFYDDHHSFDNDHCHDDYDDHHHGGHQHGGHQHGGHQHGGHQHGGHEVIVDEGLPYPGLVSGDFGGMGHIHELAMNVRYLANHITFDMWYNYQFNPYFNEVYAKCYEFRNLAYLIHDMEHTGDHVEMTVAINQMDAIFHSLEHDIALWHRVPRLQIGQGDIRYKMELLEDMMHHLMNDAGIRSQFLIDSGAVVPAPAVVPPPGPVVPAIVTPSAQVVPLPQ